MIKLRWDDSFKKYYRVLPEEIKKRVNKQFAILADNINHPSLRIKKMRDSRNIWEGRITDSYRFTFQIDGDVYILRKIGNHDILKNP